MARTESGDYKEALDMADEGERDAESEQQAIDDAEHAIMMLAHDNPIALMEVFHDNATKDDLDAMDKALGAYIRSLPEGQSCAFYDALVRIVKEHGNDG